MDFLKNLTGGLGTGIAGVATGALSSGFGALVGNAQSNKQYHQQKKLAKLQYDLNMQSWNAQNAYNTPAAQMERFKEAGLNPNLMYSQGSSGQASDYPKYQAPTIDTRYDVPNPIDKAMGFYSQFQSIKNMKADAAVKDKQVDYYKTMVEEALSRIRLNNSRSALTSGQSALLNGTAQYQIDSAFETARANKLENKKREFEITLQPLRLDQLQTQINLLRKQIISETQKVNESISRTGYNSAQTRLASATLQDKQIELRYAEDYYYRRNEGMDINNRIGVQNLNQSRIKSKWLNREKALDFLGGLKDLHSLGLGFLGKLSQPFLEGGSIGDFDSYFDY